MSIQVLKSLVSLYVDSYKCMLVILFAKIQWVDHILELMDEVLEQK